MKRKIASIRPFIAMLLLIGIIATIATGPAKMAFGQGTVVFNGQVSVFGTNYYELGMWFGVVHPTGGSYDSLGIIPPNTYNNLASNSTPYLDFFRQLSPSDYVSFSLTNGSPFGLSSVWLADPTAPSPSPVSISFVGHPPGGGSVTNTFTTPGGGATTFASYTFNPAFASGLTSVDIFAPRWAMDNLVFTPEPSATTLLGLALLSLAAREFKRRQT